VISDSGTLSEESAILKFPGVLIRTSTERPEALDAGSVIIGGITTETVEQAIDMSAAMFENQEPMGYPRDYQDENVSIKVVKLIQSYTDIVRRTVWLEH
jgi:UDP-N-acetylglucosamine 2-epimerase (non-hydrolysing)